MIGSGVGGLLIHVVLTLLFLVWALVAAVVQAVTSLALAVWAAVVWVVVALLTVFGALSAGGSVYWDWSELDTSEIAFPEGFVWGVATAAHQVEGGNTSNNWYRWEVLERPPGADPTIKRGEKSGAACDHWNLLEEDVGLVKALGVGSYRFSIEWSRLEPEQGKFDEAAWAHYHEELDLLRAAGLTPMVTLLHFSHPGWFEDLGAFEKEENIKLFVAFCTRAYKEYGSKVKQWCTINEPEVCTCNGYVLGFFPPGMLGAMHKAGTVLGNLLKAHIEVYHAIHDVAAQKEQEVEVGIVKDLFQFHPNKWYNMLDQVLAWIVNRLWNGVILDFLRTGQYRWWVPLVSSVRFTDKRAPKANDFVGLNYYSHYYVSLWAILTAMPVEKKLSAQPLEIMTDMPQCMYPEGLYCAIKEMCKLGHPLYVTENGIADREDSRRPLYLRRYLYALSKALADGCDVRGYYYWSLYDNFEWSEGYFPRFGLYHVDFNTQQRTLRDGSKYFKDVVEGHAAGKYRTGTGLPGMANADLESGTGAPPPPPGAAAVADSVTGPIHAPPSEGRPSANATIGGESDEAGIELAGGGRGGGLKAHKGSAVAGD